MAFNLRERFPPPPTRYTLLDPGAYEVGEKRKIIPNKFPFLSNTPRNTQAGIRLYSDAIHHADLPPKIPNCSSLMSKQPRFPYEALSKKDLEEILCRCGIQIPCECPTEEEEEEEDFICQAKVRRRIFKGPPPRSSKGGGLSVPSKRDHGFDIMTDGSYKRIREVMKNESPPFYDARVNEFTATYQGCKWSKRTSKREIKSFEVRPGPADYTMERIPNEAEICLEKLRSSRRQTSKQLRFIEMVQHRNILEGRPGPASYRPELPKGTNLHHLGPKAERFTTSKYDKTPGPTTYWLKRDFDPPEPIEESCHAKLPEPACFGIKAPRFKTRIGDGPSPASYYPNNKRCQFIHCPTGAFGSSAERFKEKKIEDDIEEILTDDDIEKEKDPEKPCPDLSAVFKSRTKRLKDYSKILDEPSPADLPQSRTTVTRLTQLQYIAPFFSSQGRFRPWYDWLPVYGRTKTPGPCYYSIEKPRCLPAVHRGPIFRSPRFPCSSFQTPAPNEYEVNNGGIETILATHNQRLKDNITNQHQFHWEPPVEPLKLSYEERETLLLRKSIALLENCDMIDNENVKSNIAKSSEKIEEHLKPKLLRCFLYKKPMPLCV